jgi:hypothetical protein
MSDKYDVVDVHLTSETPLLDTILEHPLLDGNKQYTVEVTEFTSSLGAETPLPPLKTFKDHPDVHLILRVRRKNVGSNQITGDGTDLTDLAVIGPRFEGVVAYLNKTDFMPSVILSLQNPVDFALRLQEFFDRIKETYVTNPPVLVPLYAGGLIAVEHGGGADITQLEMQNDSFVKVSLTANLTLRFKFSPLFTQHFFLQSSPFGVKLLGLQEDTVCFRQVGGVLTTGVVALLNNGLLVLAGSSPDTVVLQSEYPLTTHFEHRIKLEIDSGGMSLPSTVDWTTTNKQSIRHTLASFPLVNKIETGIKLNSIGASTGELQIRTNMYLGNYVWRRAENKISERYQLLNSKFFQNIRLEVYITRRVWDYTNNKYVLKRRALTMGDNDTWTAKLRFRTF